MLSLFHFSRCSVHKRGLHYWMIYNNSILSLLAGLKIVEMSCKTRQQLNSFHWLLSSETRIETRSKSVESNCSATLVPINCPWELIMTKCSVNADHEGNSSFDLEDQHFEHFWSSPEILTNFELSNHKCDTIFTWKTKKSIFLTNFDVN